MPASIHSSKIYSIPGFPEKLFSKYVDYNFTAGLENQLDDITAGKERWVKVLEMFWKDFNQNVVEVKEKRTREVLDLLVIFVHFI